MSRRPGFVSAIGIAVAVILVAGVAAWTLARARSSSAPDR